ALRDSLEQSAAILGDRLRLSHPVTRADLRERWIEVDAARIRARALVIATGTFHQDLFAAPDGAFGGDVTYLLEARPGRLVRRADGQRRRLEAGGLVVKIARVPRTDLFRGQLELDRAGAIVVDRELHTSCDGVFAAGDVVADSYARVASALGQGSLAARSVL